MTDGPATAVAKQRNARLPNAGTGGKASVPSSAARVSCTATSVHSTATDATSAAGTSDDRPPTRTCASAAMALSATSRAPNLAPSFVTLNERVWLTNRSIAKTTAYVGAVSSRRIRTSDVAPNASSATTATGIATGT